MIRTYDLWCPMTRMTYATYRHTTASGLVITGEQLANGLERWTYDYSGCSY